MILSDYPDVNHDMIRAILHSQGRAMPEFGYPQILALVFALFLLIQFYLFPYRRAASALGYVAVALLLFSAFSSYASIGMIAFMVVLAASIIVQNVNYSRSR